MKVEMERKFRPRSEVCGKKRENGEEEDEVEMENEGMREKVKMEGCVTNELMRYLCECLD